MGTERKQVLGAGDTVDELVSQVEAPTKPIPSADADRDDTVHGEIDQLTFTGEGFYDPPLNVAEPEVAGTVKVGETLTTDNGAWGTHPEAPVTGYEYVWQSSADGVTGWFDISGEIASTLLVDVAQEGEYIRSGVAAVNKAGMSDLAYSEAVGPVAAA